MEQITLTNLVPNPSFEADASWSNVAYDSSEKCFGNRSQKFAVGTSISTCPMSVPVVGHTYYGRHYLKSNGNNAPSDCRFEWFAGDGPGLNFIFGWNRGDWPDWGMESSLIEVTSVNGSAYVCRSFVVNGTAEMWADGLMILDLTAAFGAGREPDKAWCDANIPFFVGSQQFYVDYQPEIVSATVTPNPATINSGLQVAVGVRESPVLVLFYHSYPLTGSFASGQALKLGVQTEVNC